MKDVKMKWKKRLMELNRLRAKHGRDRSLVRKFPDLSVEQRTSPTSDRFGPSNLKRAQLEAILGPNFVIEHLHKSGYQVLLKEDAKWFGRKP
jgi:hypothetical protein